MITIIEQLYKLNILENREFIKELFQMKKIKMKFNKIT